MVCETENNGDTLTRLVRERDLYKLQVAKIQAGYEAKIKELSILKELGETLRFVNNLETKVFWENQLAVLTRSLSFKAVSLVLFDSGEQALETVACVGDPVVSENIREIELDATKQAFSIKQPVTVTGGESDGNPEAAEIDDALLCLPVLHNKNCIGILQIWQRGSEAFDPNMVRFLSLVADGFATGIILSRIYGQMVQEERQRVNLSRFFSEHVREKIIDTQENLRLGGERKTVSILFADLQGFTSMSERIDHEKVVEILNSYFSRMTPIIFQHNGTLDKLMGDGMLALFGAPLSHEDDLYHAVLAAIAMQKALKQFNTEHASENWPLLNLTVGINQGEVVAGYIGSEDHMNYTVIGDAVNVAQRIQSIAGANKILISGSARDGIVDRMVEIADLKGLKKLPSQKLKGKKKEIDIYELQL